MAHLQIAEKKLAKISNNVKEWNKEQRQIVSIIDEFTSYLQEQIQLEYIWEVPVSEWEEIISICSAQMQYGLEVEDLEKLFTHEDSVEIYEDAAITAKVLNKRSHRIMYYREANEKYEKAQKTSDDLEANILYEEAEPLYESACIYDSKEKAKLCRKKTGRAYLDDPPIVLTDDLLDLLDD